MYSVTSTEQTTPPFDRVLAWPAATPLVTGQLRPRSSRLVQRSAVARELRNDRGLYTEVGRQHDTRRAQGRMTWPVWMIR
jgi:hypothetical protein